MTTRRPYHPVDYYTRTDAEAALRADDIDTLIYIAFSMAMRYHDWKYVQHLCIHLSEHAHPIVRANALLGLAYLARFHHQLDKPLVKPVLLRGLRDPEEQVREEAADAIKTINSFMRWRIGLRPKD
jgi:hypothetical protein